MTKKILSVSILLLLLVGSAFAQPQFNTSLTKENPISIDLKNKSISFLAQVNGKYLYQGTRHFAVHEEGSNGSKAVFKGLVHHLDFYEALKKINTVPGNNMTLKNKETTRVQGSELAVTVTWKGAKRSYTIDEVINDSNKKPIVMKFGGNFKNAKKLKTGCLLCLDSCPVGVVSNSAYTYGAVEKRKEVTFKGNKEVLPSDGTHVVITLAVK